MEKNRKHGKTVPQMLLNFQFALGHRLVWRPAMRYRNFHGKVRKTVLRDRRGECHLDRRGADQQKSVESFHRGVNRPFSSCIFFVVDRVIITDGRRLWSCSAYVVGARAANPYHSW